jgi:hypothetical protein
MNWTTFYGGLGPSLIILVAIGVIVWFILPNKEHFVPEFLDQGNVKRTMETATSSYAQETNHFKLTPPAPEPIDGSQTPFRVNMFNSYTV